MQIARIGHASLVVSTDQLNCFMDPVMVQPFAGGSNRFKHGQQIDAPSAAEFCNAIVLSHSHPDHFSIPSLAFFDRNTPVYFPKGDQLIAGALARMGFTELTELAPFSSEMIGDLELIPTPSHVAFPELGLLFRCGDRVAWNPVDTVVGPETLSFLQRRFERIDVLFAKYQPLLQDFRSLGGNTVSIEQEYSKLIRDAIATNPRCIIPGSCGFEYTVEWLNDWGFPISERRFLRDIARLRPEVLGVRLAPSDSIDLESLEVSNRYLSFSVCRSAEADYWWRPDAGIPPLSDPDSQGHGVLELRRAISQYLEGPFLQRLTEPQHAGLVTDLARLQAVWQLDIVFPDHSRETRYLSFADGPRGWSRDAPEPPHVVTSVAASAVVGLLDGERDRYSVSFGLWRSVSHLYETHGAGITMRCFEGASDDPLACVLFPGSTERMVDRELTNLGY